MRISDWSSDVCSSDLTDDRNPLECSVLFVEALPGAEVHLREASVPVEISVFGLYEMLDDGVDSLGAELRDQVGDALREAFEFGVRVGVKCGAVNLPGDGKSAVLGKSVSVRVDLGGQGKIHIYYESQSRVACTNR